MRKGVGGMRCMRARKADKNAIVVGSVAEAFELSGFGWRLTCLLNMMTKHWNKKNEVSQLRREREKK